MLDRYAEKENYVHVGWTLARRRGHINATLLSELDSLISGRDVLMLGCNTGSTLELLLERGAQAFGIDINAAAIAEAERRGLECLALVRDALDNQFADESFDTLLALDFIEHIYAEHVPQLVAECARVLRPGGHLLAFSPRTDPEDPSQVAMDWRHVQHFATPKSFSAPWLGAFELVGDVKHETRSCPSGGDPHDAWLMVLRRRA